VRESSNDMPCLYYIHTLSLCLARTIQELDDETVESKLLLCGSRGVGGVVTSSRNRSSLLYLFDLEEDEENEDEEEMEE